MPAIVNTDQGSKFSAEEFTHAVLRRGCKLPKYGKGACRANVFVKSCGDQSNTNGFLQAYGAVSEAKADVAIYIDWYNRERVHSSIEDRTPE